MTSDDISAEDYEHAINVFETFEHQNMLEYMMMYMRLDTYLLADVFSNFRATMHQEFGLDPCHFISLPSFGFQAMLKHTGIILDNIYNMDIYLMLSQNIRGGLSFVANRMEESVDSDTGKKTARYVIH